MNLSNQTNHRLRRIEKNRNGRGGGDPVIITILVLLKKRLYKLTGSCVYLFKTFQCVQGEFTSAQSFFLCCCCCCLTIFKTEISPADCFLFCFFKEKGIFKKKSYRLVCSVEEEEEEKEEKGSFMVIRPMTL
jgi:hypothetical protein